jgi:dolichyl-phosphate beta-glucosyltransferase
MKPEGQLSGQDFPVEISLLLPAFNEEEGIAGTLASMTGYFENKNLTFEILVIVDGTDRTRDIVSELAGRDPHIRVMGGKERRGKGYAVRMGIAEARGQFIGFADADNKTPIGQLDQFLPWLKNGMEVVIGTRRHPGAQIERKQNLYRRFGSQVFSVFMHGIIGLRDIPDTQCGFKFFRSQAAKILFGESFVDGYIFDVEILFRARQRGYRIVQIPVRWRDDGDSRIAPLRSNLQSFTDVLRIRFHRYPE